MTFIRLIAWIGVLVGVPPLLMALAGVGIGRWWGPGRLSRPYAVALYGALSLLNLRFALLMPHSLSLTVAGAGLVLLAVVLLRPRTQPS